MSKWIEQPGSRFIGTKSGFIDWQVETSQWYKAMQNLEDRVQRKNTNTILRKTAKRVFFAPMKASLPAPYHKIKHSIGAITSKKRHLSTVFVGPRVPLGWNEMPMKVHKALKISGRLSNITDYSKGRLGPTKRTRLRATAMGLRGKAQAVLLSEMKKLIMSK